MRGGAHAPSPVDASPSIGRMAREPWDADLQDNVCATREKPLKRFVSPRSPRGSVFTVLTPSPRPLTRLPSSVELIFTHIFGWTRGV
jgi:hypothetical protein